MSDARKKENLFAKLAAQQPKPESEAADVSVEPVAPEPPPSPAPEVAKPKAATARKKSEPVKGKRENPAYVQANAYVPKTVRKAVDKALFDIEGLDYSSLVEDLLRKWLKSRGVSA
jgi:hypothetical protein